jgi:hypothetical protein
MGEIGSGDPLEPLSVMAGYPITYRVSEVQPLAMFGEEIHDPERIHLMLEALHPLLLHESRENPLSHMTEGSVAEIVSHTYGPSEFGIESEPTAHGGGDGGDMEHMFHPGADVVVAGCKKHLGLVFQSSEWGTVDNGGGVTIVLTTYVARPWMKPCLQ